MGKKAVQKREYILEQAQKVFAEKGFKQVTMKDIVAACHISRGGVYLYFSDTCEIFDAVLKRAKAEQALSMAPAEESGSAREQLKQFLNAQKKELLNPEESLIIATYEYLFAQSAALSKAEMEDNFQNASRQLALLIQRGVENGEFSAEPTAAAQNIVLLLEGLRISSTVLPFDEGFLDRQMDYVLSQLEGRRSK